MLYPDMSKAHLCVCVCLQLVCWEEELVYNGLLLSGPTAVPPHKTLFKIEVNLATNFTKLVAGRLNTSAR